MFYSLMARLLKLGAAGQLIAAVAAFMTTVGYLTWVASLPFSQIAA